MELELAWSWQPQRPAPPAAQVQIPLNSLGCRERDVISWVPTRSLSYLSASNAGTRLVNLILSVADGYEVPRNYRRAWMKSGKLWGVVFAAQPRQNFEEQFSRAWQLRTSSETLHSEQSTHQYQLNADFLSLVEARRQIRNEYTIEIAQKREPTAT